jgi:WD40 repeat protein
VNGYDLGVKQDGQIVGDVALPTWAQDSADFIRINRMALESEYVSQHLAEWIDLIWGYKQKGAAAKEAHNLFFHLTYEGAVDLDNIRDPVLLEAIKDQIAQFGQTPVQMWKKPHPQRMPLPQARLQRLTLSSTLAQMLEQSDYHHPPLRRIAVSKDAPLLNIKVFPNRIMTLSSNMILGLHVWDEHASSEIEEAATFEGGGVGQGSRLRPARRYALPFTHVLAHLVQLPKPNPVLSDSTTFTPDGRLLLEGNNWDDSLRIYGVSSQVHMELFKHRDRNLAIAMGNQNNSQGGIPVGSPSQFGEMKLVLTQHLLQHKNRITCLALGRCEKILVTGSRDCTLLVWAIEDETPSSRVSGIFRDNTAPSIRPIPRHILRGHEESVIQVAVDSELDLCVSISSRGQVLMHSLRKGHFVMNLVVPRLSELVAKAAEARQRRLSNAVAAAVASQNGGQAPQNGIGHVILPSIASSASSSAAASPRSSSPSGGASPSMASPASHQPGVEVLLSRARTGSIADSAPPAPLHLAKLVSFASEGILVFYSLLWDGISKRFTSPQLSRCTLNGRHWRATALEEYIQVLCVSSDGKLVATGSEDGMVVLRRLYDLKVVQRFEPALSSITSLAFSQEQDYIFCGTTAGTMLIYAVKC